MAVGVIDCRSYPLLVIFTCCVKGITHKKAGAFLAPALVTLDSIRNPVLMLQLLCALHLSSKRLPGHQLNSLRRSGCSALMKDLCL